MKTWLWNQAVLKSCRSEKLLPTQFANCERLTQLLDNASVPLDNNATERGIRGPVVNRKKPLRLEIA